jgi:anhydro-N-acetylmuramic acid kinase
MVYRAIGLMSGNTLEGLDMVFAEFHENSGAWQFTIKAAERYPYENEWVEKLRSAGSMTAANYLMLHAAYGHYTGELVNRFIEKYQLQYQVQLVVSHGHTVFHDPGKKMTAQLGDGAALAAVTGINVVSDLRAMNVALGGNGNDILQVGEKLLALQDNPVEQFKEALVTALLGLLRWREENNMLASYTGASRDSIGGAVWIGQDA